MYRITYYSLNILFFLNRYSYYPRKNQRYSFIIIISRGEMLFVSFIKRQNPYDPRDHAQMVPPSPSVRRRRDVESPRGRRVY